MKNYSFKLPQKNRVILGITIPLVILLSIAALLGYRYAMLHKNYVLSQEKIAELDASLKVTGEVLEKFKNENAELTDKLKEEEERSSSLQKDVRSITRTANTLEKLTKLDKQLLEKYSKVYFLNENYTPSKLKNINSEYIFDKAKPQQIHADVHEFLIDLLEDAKEDGIELKVISGYRSFDTQAALKSGYKVTYGAGANQFSADQGYSEHQLGTTVDLITPEMNGALTTSFENTEDYKWLEEKAYRYGFILSYPKGNAYYQFEPWHWRFVGRDLARKLHKEKKNFYDFDQREINEYLVDIFD